MCVCCRVQYERLRLHLAAGNNNSEAVIKALLDAYPDAAKEKAKVRCGYERRVCHIFPSSYVSARSAPLTCALQEEQRRPTPNGGTEESLPLHYAAARN